MPTLQHCALHFLDMWFLQESHFRAGLLSPAPELQHAAVTGAAAYFRVARNLHTKHDTGLGLTRYAPVLELLQSLPRTCEAGPVATVLAFARSLSKRYGESGTLSFSSKILWLYYRDPIIIYDSQAQRALSTPLGDYEKFVNAWERRWGKESHDVQSACVELPHVFPFAQCGDRVSAAEVREASSSMWFQRRVLDVQLWYAGSGVVA
jgi:hypothetical protein